MDDLISRSALLKDGIRAEHGLNEDGILYIPLRDVTRSIENAPAVEAEPVVHAHWVWDPNGCDWGIGAWRCSKCDCKNDALPWDRRLKPYEFACSHYCPVCGAKMDEEVGDG
jgi:hypothetical protein